MKKINITLVMLLALVLVFTGCRGEGGEDTTAPPTVTESPAVTTSPEATAEETTSAPETTAEETTAEETTAEETTAPVEDVYDGSRGLEYWVIGTGYRVRLVSIGSCTDTDVVVASTYNGTPVTEISAGAFTGGEKIESITLPDSITTISAGAFAGCTNLKKLVIGAGVSNFNPSVLKDCPSLESIEISPENANYSAVNGCIINKHTKTLVYATESAQIPSDGSVENIAAGAIANHKNITSLVIPEGVKTIKAGAIANCPELETVALPASLETFEEGALVGCPKLSSLSAKDDGNYVVKGNCLISIPLKRLILGFSTSVIPDDLGIVYIGKSAFEGSGITSVSIPDSVTTIEESAFRGCTALKSVTLPDSLTTISDYAFYECSALEAVEFLRNVKTIGKYAFKGCTSLTSLRVGSYIKSVGEAAFKDCTSIKTLIIDKYSSWSNSDIYFGKSVFEGCTALESVEISDSGLITYGEAAFKNCTSLKSFRHVRTYNYVPAEMFYGCTSLEEIEFSDNLSEIRNNAFYSCTSLGSVTVGESLQKIQDNAFYGCRSLGEFVYLGVSGDWQGITKSANWRDGALFTDVKCSDKTIGVNDPLNHNGAPGLVHVMNADGNSATLTDLGKWWFSNGAKFADTYNGVPVTHIAPDVFKGRVNVVQKITLPQSLVEICEGQFIYCNRLSSVTIPATVKEIGADAFRGCLELETVTFKGTRDQWKQIKLGENWNIGCNFTTVTCSDGTLTVDVPAEANDGTPGLYYGISNDGYAYLRAMDQNCTETEIRIATEYRGYKVTRIYERALQYNTQIKSVIIPEGITSIGDYSFYGCSSLKSVKLPKSLLSIGEYAFAACPEFKSISLPDGLTTLIGNAFYGTPIKELYIPKNVTDIGWIECETLATIEIHPDNPRYRFVGNCYIDKETKTLLQVFGKPTFPTDGSIETFGEGVLWGNEEITELIIPEGVTHLWNNAIGDNPNLKKLHIPSTLVEIYSPIESYFDLRNLEKITVAAGNERYYAKDNCLIEKDTGLLMIVNKYGKIPTDGSIKSIGEGAFAAFKDLKSIVIPEGVVSIEAGAFSGCSSLESVSFPESLESIGSYAFGGCTSLKKIDIGDNVKHFGTEVFAGCTALEEVSLPKEVEYWTWGIFDSCTSLKRIVVPYGVKDFDIRRCTSLTEVVLPETVTHAAFNGCTSLRTVILPESMRSMYDMFFGCTGLEEIVLPAGLTVIYSEAFYDCTSLKKITIEGDITEIGTEAFRNCISLETITLPASVKSIRSEAFKGCTALREIVFEGSKAEWAKISKGANWDTDTALAVIRCSDGNITADAQPEDYSDMSKIPESLRDVLLGKATFRYAGKGVDILLEDIETSWEKGILKEKDNVAYAVLDMDGDGKLEVVVSTYFTDTYYDSNSGDKIILREEGGVVYGYHFGGSTLHKGDYMEDIKADGSFIWCIDTPMRYDCYATIRFSGEKYTIVTHCKYSISGADAEYDIAGKKVTREEFNEYTKRFDKDHVIWYHLDRYPLENSTKN